MALAEEILALQGGQAGPSLLPDIRNATLGVQAIPEIAPADQQGKFLGFGTLANADRAFFNTKAQIMITPDVANALNQRIGAEEELVRTLMTQAQEQLQRDPNARMPFISGGLFGPLARGGGLGFYVPGIDRYYPDDRASIYVPAVPGSEDIGIVLPGSVSAALALARGVPAGQVRVKNPANRTGYVKVGGSGWANTIRGYVNRTLRPDVERESVEHMLCQAGVYGFGPVFNDHGIQFQAVSAGEGAPVRFRLTNRTLETLAGNTRFLNDIATLYDFLMYDPADGNKGRYGAANLALKNAGRTNLQATGAPVIDDPEQIAQMSQQIAQQFANTGSAAGFRWSAGYTTPAQRLGLTAFPMRDANGNPLSPAQSTNPRAGFCSAVGSGPGITQNARAGGEGAFGFKFYPTRRDHATGPATYHCGDTPSNQVNRFRDVYAQGGWRAPQQSLTDDLNARLQYLPEEVRAQFSPEALDQLYINWATGNEPNPRTNPFFMFPPQAGTGFSRAAPLAWRDIVEEQYGPEAAQRFENADLSLIGRQMFADEVIANLQGGGAALNLPPGALKTSGTGTGAF
jgi:hypothetical protein